MSQRQILVTSALPYVNKHIHVGHLVEHIQTNIWVRFQRLRGHEVRYFCADDTHGTATMMWARQEGSEPEALLDAMSRTHQRDLGDFGVTFDHYGSTHSPSNRRFVHEISARCTSSTTRRWAASWRTASCRARARAAARPSSTATTATTAAPSTLPTSSATR
jgi:methionyl-tRNA synthetase